MAKARPPSYFYSMSVAESAIAAELPEIFARWFAARGWAPRAHQLALLDVARAGRSALLIAPTGAGKTLAGFLPSLVELATASSPRARHAPSPHRPSKAGDGGGQRAAFADRAAPTRSL